MSNKAYGVKMTLPEHDPMALPHLLGKDFVAERWFETKEARETFLKSYQENFIFYRQGDNPRYIYELIDKI
ncbi:hypothetical protein OXI21_00455 [Ignatzschineria sp. RMDPL8A]|uniref:hypothetical protein n=1 Tax=Ignatzschineria sp. RMDPL8A TaxID=2999236 RepID=UPI0024465E08|nr:hypothetical protein [Ignatzschineria sp. RMDPL8A]MDG9728896.1 hypothetical protein [Ignatzschineria sp. RMDPL8A]